MDRLTQIKAKIERAKTYGVDPNVTLADIEWLIEQCEYNSGLVREAEMVGFTWGVGYNT